MTAQPPYAMPTPGIWECCNGRVSTGHRIVLFRHPLWWFMDRFAR